MNNRLQKALSDIENCIAIQKDCVVAGGPETEYMRGMLNGLICAYSVYTDTEPDYCRVARRKKRTNIRHKSLLEKGER